jgi:hypothetical protein
MTRPLPGPARCVICNSKDASPREGHTLPFCSACHGEWLHSKERARAATAREDFVRRARAEHEQPAPKRTPVEDDSWST